MSNDKLLLAAGLMLVTVVLPLPTAAATSCTIAVGDNTCDFDCSAGYTITVANSAAGTFATGNCGGATAACEGAGCTASSDTTTQWSETGICVSDAPGASCNAPSTASDPCTSDGAFALGIIPISAGGVTVGYIDDRNFPVGNGIWVYLETNTVPGLQRGGASILLGAEDVEICNESSNPDTLIL